MGKKTKETKPLKDALAFGQRVHLQARSGGLEEEIQGLWLVHHLKSSHTGRSQLTITLQNPLCADYIAKAKKHHRSAIPLLQHEVPLKGISTKQQANARQLAQSVIEYLHEEREQYLERGTVKITQSKWLELLKRQGLKKGVLPGILESWVRGDGLKAPAFIAMEGEEVRLSAAYEATEQFIKEAAVRTQAGRARSKRRKKDQNQRSLSI